MLENIVINKSILFESLMVDFALAERKNHSSLVKCKSYTIMNKYLSNTLKSKIEVVASVGGLKLMQEFMEYLQVESKQDLANIFNEYADGICGWCKQSM